MRILALLIAMTQLVAAPFAVTAQDAIGARTVSTVSWVEEWDPVSEQWVRFDDEHAAAMLSGKTADPGPAADGTSHEASRFALSYRSAHQLGAIAQYGPFAVISADRAALMGSTDIASPAQFDAMLRDFPGIAMLEMIEAPGTTNDVANLALGRRIRDAGIATHVPADGSVRSGAVELFIAGSQRSIEQGAYFAVHSWLDNNGLEPSDFAPDAPENRLYLDFYVEMGMSEARAQEFYAVTNSVPHEQALWLRAEEMAQWIAPENAPARAAIRQVAIKMNAPAIDLPQIDLAPVIQQTRMPPAFPAIAYSDVIALTPPETS